MKNFIFLVIIFFQQLTFSQDCDHFALKTDITNNPALGSAIEANPELIVAWKIIVNKPEVRVDPDALIAVLELRNNSNLPAKLGGIDQSSVDQFVGDIKSWGVGNEGTSYKDICIKINELVNALPENVVGFNEYVGTAGFANGGNYTVRHSWIQLERLIINKQKLSTADEIVFEHPIGFNGFNSVTDVYLRIGSDIYEIETKAGMNFFENISGGNSNFSTQSFNSLRTVNKIENYKVFLNPTIKNGLSNTDKLSVVSAWKNWENGAILNDSEILDLFTDFAKRNSGNASLPKFTSQTLENYLTNTNAWFDSIFKSDLIQ